MIARQCVYLTLGKGLGNKIQEHFATKTCIGTIEFLMAKKNQFEQYTAFCFYFESELFPVNLRAELIYQLGLDERFDFSITFEEQLFPNPKIWRCDACHQLIDDPVQGVCMVQTHANGSGLSKYGIYHNYPSEQNGLKCYLNDAIPPSKVKTSVQFYPLSSLTNNANGVANVLELVAQGVSIELAKRVLIPGYEILKGKHPEAVVASLGMSTQKEIAALLGASSGA